MGIEKTEKKTDVNTRNWLTRKAIMQTGSTEAVNALSYPWGELLDSDPEDGDPQYMYSKFFSGRFYIPIGDSLPKSYGGLTMRLGYLKNHYKQQYDMAKKKTLNDKDKKWAFTISDVAENIGMLNGYLAAADGELEELGEERIEELNLFLINPQLLDPRSPQDKIRDKMDLLKYIYCKHIQRFSLQYLPLLSKIGDKIMEK